MIRVSIHEAEERLAALIAQVEAGEDVVLARDGEDVARLIGIRQPVAGRRTFGALAGRLEVGREFFEPMPADEADRWE